MAVPVGSQPAEGKAPRVSVPLLTAQAQLCLFSKMLYSLLHERIPPKVNKTVKIYRNVFFTVDYSLLSSQLNFGLFPLLLMHLNIAASHESSSSRCCFLVSSSLSIPILLSWLPTLCNFAMMWYLLEILSPGLLLHAIYFLLDLGGRKIILRELVREAVKGNCSNEKKGKWDWKMAVKHARIKELEKKKKVELKENIMNFFLCCVLTLPALATSHSCMNFNIWPVIYFETSTRVKYFFFFPIESNIHFSVMKMVLF